MPSEIDGKWNWGAFLFPVWFAIDHGLWLWALLTGGLLLWAVIAATFGLNILPFWLIGAGLLVFSIILAKWGNALAWRSRRWESIEHFERTQRKWAWRSLVTLIVAIVGAWLIVVLDSEGGRQPRPAAFHRAHLAEGETPSLAAMLVDVPGYGYVDASQREVQNLLGDFDRKAMTGLSIHVVVDQQGTEIAYLELFEWAPEFLPLLGDPEFLASIGPPTSQMLVGSQKVFFFENPLERPWTRNFYVWFMGRTMAFADADDQRRFLSWMRAYLARLGSSSGGEPTGSGTLMCKGEVATITGTLGHDELTGTFRPDVIVGLGGDDLIQARDGNDTICGGGGNDTISASWGQDSIDGNSGEDTLNGGPGSDTLNGGSGSDTLNGFWGTDTCIHGEDNSRCEA